MTPQNTTIGSRWGSSDGRKLSESMPFGTVRMRDVGAMVASVCRSRSLTTNVAVARIAARASNARNLVASRRKTQERGGTLVAARSDHFAESTSTMSSTAGTSDSSAANKYFAIPEQYASTRPLAAQDSRAG